MNVSGLKYMVKLIDHYGINIIKKGKNRYYSPKLKREMIDKVLLEGWFSTKCLPRLWPLKLRVA
ncbi:Transposase [Streptococcus thermophilus CNCM I-1630]|nr:Transposase [Streptococcus thermophilus CNCM I-1630]